MLLFERTDRQFPKTVWVPGPTSFSAAISTVSAWQCPFLAFHSLAGFMYHSRSLCGKLTLLHCTSSGDL